MKHPFKKVGSLLAVTVMIMGSLVGCSSTGKDEDKGDAAQSGGKIEGTLDVAVFEGGYGTAFWEEAEKKF